ncbi:CRISPR-associated Csm5 family protein [Caldicellulosiruptor bescii]|uniref:CRISPR system Cms protein Csm5 n=2 Tax=Caldicellulosiruptor bescii TaxID=31899 RepID=B9MPX2_CALBD|nr:type III-A CRISPR-associated RAMP protein Csm5 [Caldicellulosiruptor bescii]ACM61755.1 CRISPR-associated RAMP protein, Csm5 family [Caldicellulosiruptor bescii DSM 6725]PBC88445.1 CRISPR-associated Csm5 family protein [Caldicellulosiruptor bescii]PBC92074.1 CRISPR-associated Csm5 family protein [Caldicellulosiruptor bescii]PBD02511.1 CRISPR-associated Csm5 family protein [Caldicellulosiruptor bescii]PBD05253.1 CRISPR-associated Csm5 family protein [Caldicellulosiruptor bescii]
MAADSFESKTYEIEVLTPTIIGGQDKIQSFEFVREGEYLYFLNFDKLFEQNLFKDSFIEELSRELSSGARDFNIKDILKKYSIDFKKAVKYTLRLEGVTSPYREVVAFVKSAGRFYIPGSSLKGAMRSSMTKALSKNLLQFYESALSNAYQKVLNRNRVDPKFVSRDADEKIFGTPYESPFKYLRVSDSSFVGQESAGIFEIKVLNICSNQPKWFSRNGNIDDPKQATAIVAEGLKPGVKLYGSIKVEKDLIEGNAAVKGLKEKLLASGLSSSPYEFVAQILNSVAKDYIQKEMTFYSKYNQKQIVSEYQRLLNILNSLDKNKFLLQIGFSTGYLSKTVGIFFNKSHFEKLSRVDTQSKIYPDIFPKSRRLLFKDGQVWTVPGWIKVTIR